MLLRRSRIAPVGIFMVCLSVGLMISTTCVHAGLSDLLNPSRDSDLDGVEQDIDGLMQVMEAGDAEIAPEDAVRLLDFVLRKDKKEESIRLSKREGAPGKYYEYSIRAPLAKVVRYTYNPTIPGVIVGPALVRTGMWTIDEENEVLLRNAWKQIGKVREPIVIRGAGSEESTPDPSGGAYYRYFLDRLFVLTEYKDTDFFISVSRQPEESEVGRKGVVVGEDKDWSYFYSGEKGVSMSGVSWADTFIYSSYSVMVFYEPEPNVTNVAIFKWIRAGWSGINMVRPSNIEEGCERLERCVKEVLESPLLPEVETIHEKVRELNALSKGELQKRLAPYVEMLRTRSKKGTSLARDDFRRILKNDYLGSFSKDQLISELLKQYIKAEIRRPVLQQASGDK